MSDPGWDNENPLDNALVVIAAQLMVPLMRPNQTDVELRHAADHAYRAAKELLRRADWTLP